MKTCPALPGQPEETLGLRREANRGMAVWGERAQASPAAVDALHLDCGTLLHSVSGERDIIFIRLGIDAGLSFDGFRQEQVWELAPLFQAGIDRCFEQAD